MARHSAKSCVFIEIHSEIHMLVRLWQEGGNSFFCKLFIQKFTCVTKSEYINNSQYRNTIEKNDNFYVYRFRRFGVVNWASTTQFNYTFEAIIKLNFEVSE